MAARRARSFSCSFGVRQAEIGMNEIKFRRWDRVLIRGALGWALGAILGFSLGANLGAAVPSIIVFTILFGIFGMLV